MRCLGLLSLTFFLTACSAADRPPPIDIHVTLQPQADSEMWLLRYEVSEPVEGLMFVRQRNQFRARTWVGLDGGAMISSGHGAEMIAAQGSSNVFEFQVRPYFGETQKDYEFFVRYSDGGALVYTGHMSVYPITCGGDCRTERVVGSSTANTTYTFKPRQGERVLLSDVSSSEPLDWHEEGLGRFVYFGNRAPELRDRYQFLGDPGLPKWIDHELETVVPKVLDMYSQKMALPLAKSPIIFLSFDSVSLNGSRGGVLPGQVQLSVGGSDWLNPSHEQKDIFSRLVAHELAHLWNGDLYQNSGKVGQSWTHEGGLKPFLCEH
jgi:hypothetical protein